MRDLRPQIVPRVPDSARHTRLGSSTTHRISISPSHGKRCTHGQLSPTAAAVGREGLPRPPATEAVCFRRGVAVALDALACASRSVSDLGPRTPGHTATAPARPSHRAGDRQAAPDAGHLARRPAAARARQDPRVPTSSSADAAKRCFSAPTTEGPTAPDGFAAGRGETIAPTPRPVRRAIARPSAQNRVSRTRSGRYPVGPSCASSPSMSTSMAPKKLMFSLCAGEMWAKTSSSMRRPAARIESTARP